MAPRRHLGSFMEDFGYDGLGKGLRGTCTSESTSEKPVGELHRKAKALTIVSKSL